MLSNIYFCICFQIIGFAFLLIGMCLYNNVVLEPAFKGSLAYFNRRAGNTGRHVHLEEEEAGALDNHQADKAPDN